MWWTFLCLLSHCYFAVSTEGDDIGDLRRWASLRGAWIHPNLQLVTVGAMGRGIVTLGALEAGDQLFYLPRLVWLSDEQASLLLEGILTPEQVTAVERAKAREGSGCTPNPWSLTLLVLLLTHGPIADLPSSLTEWHPLVAALPTECVGEVCGETKAPKRETEREKWVRSCLGSLRDAGTQLTPAIAQGLFANVKKEDMLWAISMVTSRLQVISNDDPPMLVPFLDFLNSHPTDDCCSSTPASRPSCADENDDSTCVEQDVHLTNYTSKRDFKAGEQLFEVYGDLTSLELFLIFGFRGLGVAADEGPRVRMVT